MKIKSSFAVLLALILLICTFVIPVNAKNIINNNNEIEIVINDDVSEETKLRIEKYFVNGIPAEEENSTYGLTCTLFGHKTECTSVYTITHKVRATEPRCKKETYNYDECTRCDYSKATLIATEYIYCCA